MERLLLIDQDRAMKSEKLNTLINLTDTNQALRTSNQDPALLCSHLTKEERLHMHIKKFKALRAKI